MGQGTVEEGLASIDRSRDRVSGTGWRRLRPTAELAQRIDTWCSCFVESSWVGGIGLESLPSLGSLPASTHISQLV